MHILQGGRKKPSTSRRPSGVGSVFCVELPKEVGFLGPRELEISASFLLICSGVTRAVWYARFRMDSPHKTRSEPLPAVPHHGGGGL